jgi:hypothetical protein
LDLCELYELCGKKWVCAELKSSENATTNCKKNPALNQAGADMHCASIEFEKLALEIISDNILAI